MLLPFVAVLGLVLGARPRSDAGSGGEAGPSSAWPGVGLFGGLLKLRRPRQLRRLRRPPAKDARLERGASCWPAPSARTRSTTSTRFRTPDRAPQAATAACRRECTRSTARSACPSCDRPRGGGAEPVGAGTAAAGSARMDIRHRSAVAALDVEAAGALRGRRDATRARLCRLADPSRLIEVTGLLERGLPHRRSDRGARPGRGARRAPARGLARAGRFAVHRRAKRRGGDDIVPRARAGLPGPPPCPAPRRHPPRKEGCRREPTPLWRSSIRRRRNFPSMRGSSWRESTW